MFFWNSFVFLISGSSAFSKTRLNIWKFTAHILLKPDLESFEHYFTSLWDECNCVVVWTFFGIAFLWDWNENWPFPVLWPLLSFPNLISCVQIWKNSILRSREWLAQNSNKRVCLVLSRNSKEASVAERDWEWGREGIKKKQVQGHMKSFRLWLLQWLLLSMFEVDKPNMDYWGETNKQTNKQLLLGSRTKEKLEIKWSGNSESRCVYIVLVGRITETWH